MLNAKLEQAEGDDFAVGNDFREVGIVRNPVNFGTTTIASASQVRQTYAIVMASAPSSPYEIDEKITQTTTGAVGKVVEWDSVNNILYYIQTRHNDQGVDTNGNLTAFSGQNVITGQSSSANGTPTTSTSTINSQSFTSGYSASEIDADSGDILYIENRAPITRASDQTENVKLVIEF